MINVSGKLQDMPKLECPFEKDPETHKMGGQGIHDDKAIGFMLSCIGILKLLRVQGEHVLDEVPNLTVPDLSIEDTMAPIAPSKVGGVKVLHTHRNEQGQYLIPFTDMFSQKGKRSHHAIRR